MGLSTLVLPKEDISLPDGQVVSVRGLSLEDVTVLATAYAVELGELFNTIVTGGSEAALSSVGALASTVLTKAPLAAARAIAMACDEDNEVAAAMATKLPFPIQLDALEKIGRLTFTTEESLGKVVEIVIQVATKTADSITPLLRA